MRNHLLLGSVGSIIVLATACGGDENTTGIPDACNPLGGQGCMLPWPAMTYVKTDPTTTTGFRLDIPREAMPVNVDGVVVESDSWKRYDGYSVIGPMLASFETGVSATGLPSFKNPEESLAASSPIVLLDMTTGERAPLFAEVDQNMSDVLKRNLIIRPLARLNPKSRYVVAIRTSVKAADGSELVVPPGFAALRDGKEFGHPRFAALVPRYQDIFSALDAVGIPRSELALAWDFVTVSDEMLRSDLTTMRSIALPAIGTNGENLMFTAVELGASPLAYKRYLGTYKSPDFLTAGETDLSVMRRGADGVPVMQGMRDAPFAAIIPNCARTSPLPLPTIIFGHGLFGSAKEYLSDGFVLKLAEDLCAVVIAGDLIGLTSRQLQLAPLAANDMNRAPQITEKLAQAVIDFISLESIARGPMASASEFKFNGVSVIDPTRISYVGGSLGGIMGGTFMAYDPNITRGVLAVPGGNWSLLFERSTAWALLMGAAQGAYDDPSVYQLNIAMLGMAFEPYDPMTAAAHVIADPLFGNPVKNILIWYTLGDCLVTNIATEMMMREMGIDVLGPAVREPWQLTPKAGPLANGAVIFDAHPTPLPLDTNVPPFDDNGTHAGINKKPAALRTAEQFLIGNQVVDECKVAGAPVPCDCAVAGACE